MDENPNTRIPCYNASSTASGEMHYACITSKNIMLKKKRLKQRHVSL